MRTDARARQRGFSLLEVTVALLLLSILAGTVQLSMTRRQVEALEHDRIEHAAGDFYRFAQAAQRHAARTGKWPNEDRSCANALAQLTTAGLLKGVTAASDFLNNQEPRPYALSCDANHFTIGLTTETTLQAARLERKLPGSQRTGTTVNASYPKPLGDGSPGGGAGSGAYMPLDGSATPTATWNMGNQYMFGVRDVVSATGQTLANSVQFATAATPGQRIVKPDCPRGMQPRIFTALSQVSAPSGRGIHGIQLPVTEDDDAWTVNVVVHTPLGQETIPASRGRIATFVKCSY